ncbi:hypothetical protein G6F22_018706 [Rhizopus arrhizus]|nr:hypothetical protein G6F22_018706 [Rhizopus arrhizus]
MGHAAIEPDVQRAAGAFALPGFHAFGRDARRQPHVIGVGRIHKGRSPQPVARDAPGSAPGQHAGEPFAACGGHELHVVQRA